MINSVTIEVMDGGGWVVETNEPGGMVGYVSQRRAFASQAKMKKYILDILKTFKPVGPFIDRIQKEAE